MKRLTRILVFVLFTVFLTGGDCQNTPFDAGSFVTSKGFSYHWAQDDFPIPVIVNTRGLSPRTVVSIITASYAWNESLGFEALAIVIQDYDDFGIVDVPVKGAITFGQHELGKTRGRRVLGQAQLYLSKKEDGKVHAVVILLDHGIDPSAVYDVALHELGHALTLRHDGNSNSIMFWIIRKDQHTTTSDLEIIRRFNE